MLKQNLSLIGLGIAIGITTLYIIWFYQISKISIVNKSNVNTILTYICSQDYRAFDVCPKPASQPAAATK